MIKNDNTNKCNHKFIPIKITDKIYNCSYKLDEFQNFYLYCEKCGIIIKNTNK